MLQAPRRVGALCIMILSASMIFAITPALAWGEMPLEMAASTDPTFYLHRTPPQTPNPAPAGLRMNTTAPPSGQAEITIPLNKNTNYYWYSDLLTPGCVGSGTWTMFVWADTATARSVLDVHVDLTSSNGGSVRSVGAFTGLLITNLAPLLFAINVTGSWAGLNANDRFRLTLFPENSGANDSHMNIVYDGYGRETVGNETRLFTAASLSSCSLNLRVRNWAQTDAIQGASVYVNSQARLSGPSGWTNWTGLAGTVQVRAQYFGYLVNGTFPIILNSNKTIDIRANIYDVTVTVKPANQHGILQSANVTAYNSTQYTASNSIATGITGANGQVILRDVPNGTILFASYAKFDYSLLISENSQNIPGPGQTVVLVASQNVGSVTIPWDVYIIASIAIGAPASVNFAKGRKKS